MRFVCPQCEQEFNFTPTVISRIRFCSLACRRLAQARGIRVLAEQTPELRRRKSEAKKGVKNPMWKGDEALPHSKRARAIRRYELGDCERCGEMAIDRHHVDGDTGNNDPSNIMRLCRRCHMEVDGRLSMLGYEYGKGRYLQRERQR